MNASLRGQTPHVPFLTRSSISALPALLSVPRPPSHPSLNEPLGILYVSFFGRNLDSAHQILDEFQGPTGMCRVSLLALCTFGYLAAFCPISPGSGQGGGLPSPSGGRIMDLRRHYWGAQPSAVTTCRQLHQSWGVPPLGGPWNLGGIAGGLSPLLSPPAGNPTSPGVS